MTAVKEGIKKKLESLFNLDPLTTARDTLEKEFNKFIAPLEEFKNGAETYITQTVDSYTADLTWIKDIMDLSKIIGPIAEAAAIALQCGTPPGWGCLKILARKLQECAIEAALNICAVQKEIANLAAAVGPLTNLPATLAQTIMGVLKKAAPKGLEDIFDEPIPQQNIPSGDDIECEDSPPETKCPGLFGADMNKPGPGEDHKAMAKLQEEFGEDKMDGLQKMADAAGMPDDAPFTPEDAKDVGDKLRDAGNVSGQDMADAASGLAGPETQAKLKPLQEYLEKKAHKSVLEEVRKELKKGTYKIRFDEMAKRKMHWLLLKPYRPGPFKNMPALMWNEDIKAAGVVDGEYGQCYDDGKIPLTITRAEMYDEQNQPVVVVTPFHDADARLQGHTCDSPPPPPSPPQGGKGPGGQSGQPGGAAGGQGKAGKQQGDSGKQQGGAGKQHGGAGKKQGEPGAGSKEDQGGPAGEGSGDTSGEGGLGVGVGSDVEPGSSGDRVEESPPGTEGPKGEQEKEQPEPGGEQKEQPESNKPASPKPPKEKAPEGSDGVDLSERFDFCDNFLDCPVNVWPVEFEEIGGSFATGWQVLPGSNVIDPRGTLAITNPPNPSAILSIVKGSGGRIEIHQTENGQTKVVGQGKASSEAGMVEVTSGPLFEQLKGALKRFIVKKRRVAHAQQRAVRFHFKGD
jgi:hypothetical protein